MLTKPEIRRLEWPLGNKFELGQCGLRIGVEVCVRVVGRCGQVNWEGLFTGGEGEVVS